MERDAINLQIYDKKTREVEFIELKDLQDLNRAISDGWTKNIVNISELAMDQRMSMIADTISQAKCPPKFVLISGPSSSGKTTFSKRLSLHLLARGMKPYPISLDDYFVDRERTPKDETGDYDYESLYALDVDLFNKHLNALLNGEEIELPHYDFPTGTSQKSGIKVKLEKGMVLLLEGIHALNPLLTAQVDDAAKFKLYVSVLAPILLDGDKAASRTDSRLIRRIIRDNKYRGTSAQQTIARWPSVRRGEDKWVFPCQQYADVEFNTAQYYELAVLKDCALPLLNKIKPDAEEYETAQRLKALLRRFRSLADPSVIPTVSLLREFLGGSGFKY